MVKIYVFYIFYTIYIRTKFCNYRVSLADYSEMSKKPINCRVKFKLTKLTFCPFSFWVRSTFFDEAARKIID